MRKVISVNLNGNAYQLDEDACGLLSAYLDRAQAQLEDNPDRAEIMADLEQAIAEKCNRFLGPRKTVVVAAEIQQVIDEMGPVDSGAGESGTPSGGQSEAAEGKAEAAGSPKRLYQIREGGMIFGVCNGLAAYFNIDVTVMRLIFIVLTLLTGGIWIIVYAIMAFVVPPAGTPEQRAAAYGLPFNAQELIDQAKKKYADLKNSKQWKRQRRMQRRQSREWRRAMREQSRWAAASAPPAPWYVPDAFTVLLVLLLGIFEAGLFVLLAFSIYSLVTTGAIFGWNPPPGIPLWAGILILFVLYVIAVSPLSAARHAAHYGGHMHPYATPLEKILPLVALVVLLWLGYLYVPAVHQFIHHALDALHHHGMLQ
jgi:phage shock protein PspC (stress-responsive transcriptional regulator)